MQKIVEVRASQGSLSNKLSEYLKAGWTIVSTTRGSEWTRILNTYKWTVVLEKAEPKKEEKPHSTIASELMNAKQLLDSGAITKEEFNKIKEKLLK